MDDCADLVKLQLFHVADATVARPKLPKRLPRSIKYVKQPRSACEGLTRFMLHDFQAERLFRRLAQSVRRHGVWKPFVEFSEDSFLSTVHSQIFDIESLQCQLCPSSIVYNHGPSVSGFTPPDFFSMSAGREPIVPSHFLVCSSNVAISRGAFLRWASIPIFRRVPEVNPWVSEQHISTTQSGDELLLRRSAFTLLWLKPLRMSSVMRGHVQRVV